MRFELDKILTDEILFYMENQDGEFFLDTASSKIVRAETELDDEDRFIPLPGWDSNDGFRLMEKFAVELKNPVVRAELSAALNVKRGVFRSFKNVLEQYPEAEKMWYNFKKQKMRDEVAAWYNAMREEWGLEPVGGEPEDISSIVLEDFIFREGKEGDLPEANALHKICIDELKEKGNARVFEAKSAFNFSEGIFIASETSGGEFCGYISAEKDGSYLRVTRLEVGPEYRGMGVGKTLLAKLMEKAAGQGVVFDLPENCGFFSRALHIENFKPVMRRFVSNF
jgi:ribosomal protein S18 acetylase RimI-like enzyme